MKRIARILGSWLLLCAVALSQTPTDNPSQPGTLEGTVINIQNGRVVPRATVVLRNLKRMSEARSVRGDGQGHFVVKNLEPGSYRVSAEHQGYFSSTRHQIFQYRVDLAAGEQRGSMVLGLQPAAVVTGQITDENSDPVENVQVQLLDRSFRNGRTLLEVVGTAVSDDRGDYRIYNVRPGNYYLVAEVQHASGSKAGTAKTGSPAAAEPPAQSDIAYSPAFYPDATDFLQAQPIPVTAGDEVHANFAFAAKPSVSIRGKVVNGITGDPGTNAAVDVLWTEYLDATGPNAKASPADGSFEMRGLAPGVYTLRTAFTLDGAAYSTQRRVEVGNAGLENIVLDALPDTAVVGHVQVEGADPGQRLPRTIGVEFQSNTSPARSSATATLRSGAPAGLPEFEFQTRTHPGEQYTVSVRGLPENDYLKAVQVNGHPVERNEVSSLDQRADVDLVVSPAGGYIDGLVLDDSGQPLSGAVVVLVPEDSKQSIADLFRRSISDKEGKFRMRAVTPGSYQLFAFDDVDFNELISQPDVLKRFGDRAVAVTVEEQMDYGTALRIIHGSDEMRSSVP